MHWLGFVFKLTAEVSEEASTQYLHITEAGEDVQGTQAAVAALQNLRYTSENGKLPFWGLEYQIYIFFINILFSILGNMWYSVKLLKQMKFVIQNLFLGGLYFFFKGK